MGLQNIQFVEQIHFWPDNHLLVFFDPLVNLTALIGHKSLELTIEVLLSQFVKNKLKSSKLVKNLNRIIWNRITCWPIKIVNLKGDFQSKKSQNLSLKMKSWYFHTKIREFKYYEFLGPIFEIWWQVFKDPSDLRRNVLVREILLKIFIVKILNFGIFRNQSNIPNNCKNGSSSIL